MSSSVNKDIFKRFVNERTRQGKDFPSILGVSTSLKEFHKAYSKWAISEGSRRFELKVLEELCDEYFGASHGRKVWPHVLAFFDEEDVENFDEHHKDEILVMEKDDLELKVQTLEEENKKLKEKNNEYFTLIKELTELIRNAHRWNNHVAIIHEEADKTLRKGGF